MKAQLVTGLLLFALGLGVLGAPARLEDTLKLPDRPPPPGETFAIVLTGDGGWAELVRQVAEGLTAADVPCVGWDSRAYYWTRRTPDAAATDLAHLIGRYRREWHRPRVLLIGYSRGADVLPFLVHRLPESERAGIRLVALLAPGKSIDFEFHLADYLRSSRSKASLSVPPEIAKLKGWPLLILYGDRDEESCVATLPPDLGDIRVLPGDHHLGRDYPRIIRDILEARKRFQTDAGVGKGP